MSRSAGLLQFAAVKAACLLYRPFRFPDPCAGRMLGTGGSGGLFSLIARWGRFCPASRLGKDLADIALLRNFDRREDVYLRRERVIPVRGGVTAANETIVSFETHNCW